MTFNQQKTAADIFGVSISDVRAVEIPEKSRYVYVNVTGFEKYIEKKIFFYFLAQAGF